jgi:flavodoxin
MSITYTTRTQLSRRTVLRGSLLGGTVAARSAPQACGSSQGAKQQQASTSQPSPTQQPSTMPSRTATTSPRASRGSSVLLAYFSRPGENYYYGDRTDLEVGNTKLLAEKIATRLRCDVHEILAVEPYSDDYDDTVARNVREQDADARPEVANSLADLDGYDVVLLASPIWNVRPPMVMRSFAEALDFTGKTVHPVTTYAMSGLGTAEREYRDACRGAQLGKGLAVQGEKVNAVDSTALDGWLRDVNLF